MANPFGMAEFSVPALIGLDMQVKQRRLDQLYTQRQQAREDYQFERQQKNDAKADAEDAAYKDVFTPSGGGVAAASGAAPAPGAPISILPENNSSPGAPVPSPAGAAPGEPVAASDPLSFRPDPAKLRALAQTGAHGFQAAQAIMKMNGEQLQQAQEGAKRMLELKARIIGGVRALPPEQRPAAYLAERADLIRNGADANTLPPAWSEEMADQKVREGLTAAEALGLDADARKFAHTVAHDAATEANAAGTLEVARGGLAVRQKALNLAAKPGANTATGDLLRAAGLGN